MKALKIAFLKAVKFTLITIITVIALEACNKTSENLAPQQKQKINGARTGTTDCSVYSSINMYASQRDRIIGQYGTDAQIAYDQIRANVNPNNASTDIYNYSPAVLNHIRELQAAVIAASQAYLNDFSDPANSNYEYNENFFAFKVLGYMGNVYYSQINNDPTLSQQDKDILSQVSNYINSNILYMSSLIEDQLDSDNNASCFPNPGWYDSAASAGMDGTMQRGFFSNVLKVVKKVVNIVATIVVNVIEVAAQASIYGILAGFTFAGGPAGVLPGLAVGAIVGGALGIVKAINDMLDGNYVCVFAPCQ
jgi:hypothetical protein